MSVEAIKEPRIARRTWVAVVLITLIVAVPAFMVGPIIWPPAGPTAPTAAQIPYFIAMDAMQALFLGLASRSSSSGCPSCAGSPRTRRRGHGPCTFR